MFILTKKCNKCGKVKPVSEFHKKRQSADGYRPTCKECRSPQIKEYYQSNSETLKQKALAWYEGNKQRVLSNVKRWAGNNPVKARSYGRKWKANNKEHHDSYNRAYDAAHPEKVLEKLHRRRAKKINVEGGHFTEKEWQALLDRYGHKCLCCKRTDVPLERDHVIPLGPPHSDEIANIQPLCRRCNASKGNKVIDYR